MEDMDIFPDDFVEDRVGESAEGDSAHAGSVGEFAADGRKPLQHRYRLAELCPKRRGRRDAKTGLAIEAGAPHIAGSPLGVSGSHLPEVQTPPKEA